MEAIKRLKQTTFSLGITGFIVNLFLFAQTLGMRMHSDAIKEVMSRMSSKYGFSTLDELALKYCLITICFFLFILFLLMRNRVFFKVMGLIPLVFMIFQFILLLTLKKELFVYKWGYSNWLEITYYMDFGFLALTIILLILHIYLIKIVYRLPYGDS